LYLTNFTN